MRKVWLPVLLILTAILLLAAVNYWYTQKESDNWPFPAHHH